MGMDLRVERRNAIRGPLSPEKRPQKRPRANFALLVREALSRVPLGYNEVTPGRVFLALSLTCHDDQAQQENADGRKRSRR